MSFEKEFGMRFGDYYVVEVSMRPSNPLWRAVASAVRGDSIMLFHGYTMEEYKRKEFYTFRVVEKIQAMSDRPEQTDAVNFICPLT